jgi:hypothetical protein
LYKSCKLGQTVSGGSIALAILSVLGVGVVAVVGTAVLIEVFVEDSFAGLLLFSVFGYTSASQSISAVWCGRALSGTLLVIRAGEVYEVSS